ncbi:MAG: hypothetical protein AAF456_16000 [Planctomycetota bacterium]
MSLIDKQIADDSSTAGESWTGRDSVRTDEQQGSDHVDNTRDLKSVVATVATTLVVFGIYTIQGALVARILGPAGRGEFGTAIFFPRDIFLWAGLLGGIEIVNAYASRGVANSVSLKYSAARLGLISGIITAVVAATSAVVALAVFAPEKSYLIPMCLLCCLFLPIEHMHLTISAVDRGNEAYRRYNINRLLFALAFPILAVSVFWLIPVPALTGIGVLPLMCVVFVASRLIGLLPTLRGMDVLRNPRAFFAGKRKSDPEAIPGAAKLLSEGKPFALSMIASEVFERLDVLLIVMWASVEQSGYYFVAVPAAGMLTIVPNALAVFTFNAGANGRHVNMRECGLVMGGLIVLQAITSLLFLYILPPLIIFLNGPEFNDAVPFAIWLLAPFAIRGYLQSVDGYLKGRGKPMIGVAARVFSIIVMVIFVNAAFGSMGLFSIPAAACVGQAVSMVIISVAVLREVASQNRTNPESGVSGGESA